MSHHPLAIAHLTYLALVYPDRGIAQFLYVKHGVAAEHHGLLVGTKLVHAFHAFALKCHVANRQGFIDNQDIGAHHGGDGKGQPHIHARGIGLDRAIDEIVQLGELDDVSFEFGNIVVGHTQQRGIEIDIAATGEFRMKSSA